MAASLSAVAVARTTGERGRLRAVTIGCLTLLLAGVGMVSPPRAAAVVPPSTPWTWGGNSFGQLGDGTTADRRTPAAVGLTGVVDLHGGREHVVALRDDATAWVWGSSRQGQLGLGGTGNVSTPTRLPGLTDVIAVETGHNHSLALRADGSVWTWGLNRDGQLGDGTTTRRTSPVRVTGLADAVAIAAGRNMSYAVRAGGTLVGWGRNAEAQLGDGTTTRRLTPVRVGTLTGVAGVAGGRDHGLALLGNGSVWAWGANAYGQVGDGTRANRTQPVQVTGGITEVIAGAHHSYALRGDGQVESWGRNYRANLGDGTTALRTSPVLVRNVGNAVSIGSGRDHGLAVLADGTVRAWGSNNGGQLGDGTTTNRSTAVVVPGVNDAVKAGGGGREYSVILVGAGGPPVNQPPVARLTASCTLLSCTYDGTASTDDAGVVGHHWQLGDGATADGSTASHTYSGAGTYAVTLTVTDAAGLQDSATTTVTVSDQPPAAGAAFVAAAATDANTRRAGVSVPGAVQAGDRLLLVVTTNRAATISVPSGWTQLDTVSDGTDVRSWVLTRSAVAGSAGSTVQVPVDPRSKTSLTLLAYDAGAPTEVVGAAETGSSATHTAPAASVATEGSVVLRYWADKTSTAHGWAVPAGLAQRAATAGSSGGRLTTLGADSGDWPAGPVPAQPATAGTSASKAVSWTVVLPPG